MPKRTQDTDALTPASTTAEVLLPYSVIIDGQDRTIFARDEKDLQRRIDKIRGH